MIGSRPYWPSHQHVSSGRHRLPVWYVSWSDPGAESWRGVVVDIELASLAIPGRALDVEGTHNA